MKPLAGVSETSKVHNTEPHNATLTIVTWREQLEIHV